jgi:hypothetical protein
MDALQYMYRYPLEHERQQRAYWREIRRVCDSNLRALENELKVLRQVESGYFEALHPPHEKPKKTTGLTCIDCGAELPPRATGRPLQRCPLCLRKQRKKYQHMKYLQRRSL